jgi:hypothetical protein
MDKSFDPVEQRERSAFELHMRKDGWGDWSLFRDNVVYNDGAIERMWKVWQARAVQAQATVPEGMRIASIEECAQWVDKRRDDFMREHGYSDPDTGAWEYGSGPHAEAKLEYETELAEIAEGLRSLKVGAK